MKMAISNTATGSAHHQPSKPLRSKPTSSVAESPARPQAGNEGGAHKILVAAYHILADQVSYTDLGSYLDQLSKKSLTRNLVRRLERLGYNVKLQQAA